MPRPTPSRYARQFVQPIERASLLTIALLLTVGVARPLLAQTASTPYEDALLARALASTGLTPDPAPEGKVIDRVEVFREDVIAEADPYPQWLAAVHAKSTDTLVRQELLIGPGEVWDQARVEETARNLRGLFVLGVVRAQACAAAEGHVVLLVATKDLWSLRLNSFLTVVGSVVQTLDLQPTEQNLFGAGKAASLHFRLQQLDLSDFTLRDKAAVGVAFTDPRLFGTRWSFSQAVDLLVAGAVPCGGRTAAGGQWCPNAKPGSADGLAGSLDLQRPLFSLSTEWAFDVNVSLNRRQVRRFLSGAGVTLDAVSFDPATVPAAERVALPVVYNVAEYSGQAQVIRSHSMADGFKLDLSAGVGAFRHLYTPPGNFDYDPALVQQFVNNVLPRSEDDAYVFGSIRSRDTRYVGLRNLQAFALTEDYLLGHDVSLTLQAAANLQATRQAYASVVLRGQYRWYGNDDLLTAAATVQTRVQPNLAETGRDGPFANTSVDLSLRNASPRFLGGRLFSQARLLLRWNDLNQSVSALGGDAGLRGYVTNAFLGSDVALTNLEYRSEPWDFWSMHAGFVVFYDGGAVFSGNDPRRPTQPLAFAWRSSLGAGLRVLFPQFDKAPIRVDFGVPLGAPAGTASWITFAYAQAF
jgi:hypothetical protein